MRTISKPRYTGSWESIKCMCDILNKNESIYNYLRYMYDRTNQMFEYDGLPDTIPSDMLELYLQMNGSVCITEIEGNLYSLPGGLGGAPDPYYRPTTYVVANPGLGISKRLRILNFLMPFAKENWDGECVLVRNDTLMQGLFYLNSRYATELAENDISIRSAQINSRYQVFINATTDNELASANAFITGIEEGKTAAVFSAPFMDNIKPANISVQNSNNILQLIELQQYLKASWFNDIGLNMNFNMKREYLSEEEIQASTDMLLPLIDDMLTRREEAINLVNETYGTDIKVQKNSAWSNKQREIENAAALIEAQVEQAGGETEDPPEPSNSNSDQEKEGDGSDE